MNDANRELADVFALIGAALGYQKEAWVKVRAYLRFAELLREMDGSIDAVDDPSTLPGVGPAIAKKVLQWRAEGTFPLWERIGAEVPAGVLDMLRSGLAPAAVRGLVGAGYASEAEVRADPGRVPAKHRAAVSAWLTRPGFSDPA